MNRTFFSADTDDVGVDSQVFLRVKAVVVAIINTVIVAFYREVIF